MTNEAYRERLAELEEQNGYLREAATRFGELAERLNEELKKARRDSPARGRSAAITWVCPYCLLMTRVVPLLSRSAS